jgi:hypothetical protein
VGLVLAMAISIGAAVAARTLDDDDDLDDVAVQQRTYMLSEQQFDQILFRVITVEMVEGQKRAIVSSSKPARGQMETALTSEVERIARDCSLTETQKKKLQLAGRGDIARFLDEVAELRRKYTAVAMNEQQYIEVSTRLQGLSVTSHCLVLRENSIFRKTLRTTLNEEQLAKYQLLERERKASVVDSALTMTGRVNNGRVNNFLQLTADSRRKFINTLVNHGHIPQTPHPYGRYIVMLEAARLENVLRPLLAESEWRAIEAQVAVARQLEPILRKTGQWPVPPTDEEPEAK